jgi:hypothetical protein
MTRAVFVLGILAAIVPISTPADAQSYPWCAYYSNGFSGENCGFVTYEQCMTTLSGMGGFCARNTQYVPATGARPRYKRSPNS